MKILLISHQGEATNRTARGLQGSGFVVNRYTPEIDPTSAIVRDDGVALLVGPELKGSEPRALIRSLRNAGDDRPMLVMAPEAIYGERVSLLNVGADDVFPGMCEIQEITARIRAVVRRARGLAKPEIPLGDVVIDLNARCVRHNENVIQLTSKEYQIIELLAINRGKVISKDVIMNHLYDYDAVPDSKIIDVFICKIRRKLLEANASETISTVWGQGYIIRESHEPVVKPRATSKKTTRTIGISA